MDFTPRMDCVFLALLQPPPEDTVEVIAAVANGDLFDLRLFPFAAIVLEHVRTVLGFYFL